MSRTPDLTGSEISPSIVRTLLLPLSVCPGLCRSLHWQVPCVRRWKGPPAVSDLHHSQLAFSGRKRLCRELQYKSQVWPSGSQWSGLVGHLPLKPSLCPGRQCILAMPSSRTAPPRSYVLRMGVMAPQKDACRWSLCQWNVSKKKNGSSWRQTANAQHTVNFTRLLSFQWAMRSW